MKKLLFLYLFLTMYYQGLSQSSQTGKASYYSEKFEGKPTASGELYHGNEMTAAHPTLPFFTRIKVTNLENKRSVIVTVNDRGPFVKGRIVDLSKAAAVKLDFVDKGVAMVQLELIQNKKRNRKKQQK